MDYDLNVSELVGKIFTSIEKSDDVLIFHSDNGLKYKMYHSQDCCESVVIEDINGELNDLIGTPITLAEESTNERESNSGSETWTFYRFATVKGYVDIRWHGESNGYYSESVDLIWANEDDDFRKYGY